MSYQMKDLTLKDGCLELRDSAGTDGYNIEYGENGLDFVPYTSGTRITDNKFRMRHDQATNDDIGTSSGGDGVFTSYLSVGNNITFASLLSIGGISIITSTLSVGENVTMRNDLSVGGTITGTFGGSIDTATNTDGGYVAATTLNAINATELYSTLSVGEFVTFADSLSVGEDITMRNDLSIGNDIVVGGELSVSNFTFVQESTYSIADVASRFYVRQAGGSNLLRVIGSTGATVVYSTTDATGMSSYPALRVQGGALIQKQLYVDDNVYISGVLSIGDNTTIASLLSVGGNTLLAGTLSIGDNTTIASLLSVGGNTLLAGTLSIGDNTTIASLLSVGGEVTISNNLNVEGTNAYINANQISIGPMNVTTYINNQITNNMVSYGTRLNINGIGYALACSNDGSIIVTSSVNDSTVYVFKYISGQWKQIGNVIDDGSSAFGICLSISGTGNIIAVGDRTFNASAGRIRVYKYNKLSELWDLIGNFNGASAGDYAGTFEGVSLSNSGNILAYGEAGYSTTGRARTYSYDITSNTWTSLGDIIPDGTYSSAVELSNDGTVLAVCDPTNNYSGTTTTRIYKYSSGSWSQMGSTITGLENGDSGGNISLSKNGNKIAIGYSHYDNLDTSDGLVQVYQYSSDSWSQIGGNMVGSGETQGYFGINLRLSNDGNILAISATGEDSGDGRVYTYKYSDGSWIKLDSVTSPTGSVFGSGLGLSKDGEKLMVGDYFGDDIRNYHIINGSVDTITFGNSKVVCTNLTGLGAGITINDSLTVDDSITVNHITSDLSISGNLQTHNIHADYIITTNSSITLLNSYNTIMEKKKITASGSWSMTSFDNRIAIGDLTGNGSVYVYVDVGNGTWNLEDTLVASDGASGDRFGFSVDGYGDTIVVGADNDGGNFTGAVYVYTVSGSTWTQQQKLTASNASSSDYYGCSVAIYNDTIAVGAYGENGNRGAVYIYTRSGGTWTEYGTIIRSNDIAISDLFGISVTINNNEMVFCGASGIDAVYTFEKIGSDWTQIQKIEPSQSANSYGVSVACSGNRLVVGASSTGSIGNAYVYIYHSGTWNEEKLLDANTGSLDGHVGIKNNIITVSSKNKNSNTGSVYVYVYKNKQWVEYQELTASDATSDTWFGTDTSVNGNYIVVSDSEGGCYIFHLNSIFSASDFGTTIKNGLEISNGELQVSDRAIMNEVITNNLVTGLLSISGAADFWGDEITVGNTLSGGDSYIKMREGTGDSNWGFDIKYEATDNVLQFIPYVSGAQEPENMVSIARASGNTTISAALSVGETTTITGNLMVNNTTNSSPTSAVGAIATTGGLYVGKDIHMGYDTLNQNHLLSFHTENNYYSAIEFDEFPEKYKMAIQYNATDNVLRFLAYENSSTPTSETTFSRATGVWSYDSMISINTSGQMGETKGLKLENVASGDHWNIGVDDDADSDLSFYYNNSIRGYLDKSANVDNINFTGQHRSKLQSTINQYNNQDINGLIVSSNGSYINLNNSTHPQINESLPVVDFTVANEDKRIFGVLSDKEDSIESRSYSMGAFVTTFEKIDGINRYMVNSVGEGGIWVTGVNGNFENGDYITSSTIPGYGTLQGTNALCNYTVSKITCSMDFVNIPSGWDTRYITSNGTITGNIVTGNNQETLAVFVGCTYHCG
jgi:predicted acyltransferase (DUF342 family)